MASTHKRNVLGMHYAPRCQEENTKNGRPCGNPALRGQNRCHMHDLDRIRARKAGKKKPGRYSGETLKLDKQARTLVRELRIISRHAERDAFVPDLSRKLYSVSHDLNEITRQDHAPAEPPRAADRKAMQRRPYDTVTTHEKFWGLDDLGGLRRHTYAGYNANCPDRTWYGIRDRARGAMYGLAIGDALGWLPELQEQDRSEVLTALMHGHPDSPQLSERTVHAVMALALSESLIFRRGLDETDLMDRFVALQEEGWGSGRGGSSEIDLTTSEALDRYRRNGDPIAGLTGPECTGSDCLARLAPVAVRYWNEPGNLRNVAARQSCTTHAATEAVHACVALAGVLGEAIGGVPRTRLLRRRDEPLDPMIAWIMRGSWKDQPWDMIRGSGYVVHTLEAAFWCVEETENFAEALMLATGLGGDVHATAAVTGQLAGALYGERAIPAHWIDQLRCRGPISGTTDELFDWGIERMAGRRQQRQRRE